MEDEQAAIDAVLKFAVFALVIGGLLGLATFVGVKMLGLNGGGSADPGLDTTGGTPAALPTKALDASNTPTVSSPSTTPKPKGIELSVSPSSVAPSQRINLTGRYPGADNVNLIVQRKEGGAWTIFSNDVQVPVRVGTFATYILTTRTGVQQFRVFDPAKNIGSNPVTVTVG